MKRPGSFDGRPTSSRRTCLCRWAMMAAAMIPLLTGCGQGPARKPSPAPVRAAVAVQKDVPIRVTAIGTVEPYTTITVKSMVGGEIMRVAFTEGQDVKKGAPLFFIDPRPYEAALNQAQGNLARDQAKLKSAEAEARRYAELIEKDYVTRQQYDDVVANANALKATVRADEAAVEKAGVDLDYCVIRAPISGRTGSLLVQLGNVVKANDSQLLVLNQISPCYVAFSVPEIHLPEIRRHAAEGVLKVTASPTSGGGPFIGDLSLVNNAVDAATGTVLLKATFPNENRVLWPGTFVKVDLDLTIRKGAVVVPSSSLQMGQQGDFLYVIKPDMTVESRPVVSGQTSDGETVIEKGVSPGERVVTDGQLRLFPGAPVQIKPEAAANAKAAS